jgi:hypothetical protein
MMYGCAIFDTAGSLPRFAYIAKGNTSYSQRILHSRVSGYFISPPGETSFGKGFLPLSGLAYGTINVKYFLPKL